MNDLVFKNFHRAARAVLRESGINDFKIYRRPMSDISPAFVSIVGLVGGVKGYFLMEMCGTSALALVRSMEGHLGTNAGDEDRTRWCKAAIAELSNQISGRATALMANKRIDCMITPPTTLSGAAIESNLPESDQQTRFTVKAAWGMIHCVVAIKNVKTL